ARPYRRRDDELLEVAELERTRHAGLVDAPAGRAVEARRARERAVDRVDDPAGLVAAPRPGDRNAAHLASAARRDRAGTRCVRTRERGARRLDHRGTVLGDRHRVRSSWRTAAARRTLVAMPDKPGPGLVLRMCPVLEMRPIITPRLR